jgi:hypothetical protein
MSQATSKYDVRRAILSAMAAMQPVESGGSITGWNRDHFVRRDACGRQSTTDIAAITEAISDLRSQGLVGPSNCNGWLTVGEAFVRGAYNGGQGSLVYPACDARQ